MDSFLVVLQKLLSCSSQFRNLQNKGIRAKFLLTVPRPEGPNNENILVSCGWIFWWPAAARQVPENSLKQFRKPKPQIFISFPVAGYFLLRPDSGTQVF